MAQAKKLGLALDQGLREGFFNVADPGDAGTFYLEHTAFGYAAVVTGGSETRALPAAAGHPVGAKLTVTLKTAGGDLTITGAGAGSVVLDTVGDTAVFEVVDVNGTKTWKVAPRSIGERQRVTTSATSGTVEGTYTRLAFEADGTATGEALRAFTNVNANIATAHGAHISLSFEAAAGGSETSGLGVAVRGTTHIPDVASWAPTGTLYAGMFELFNDGAASDPAGLTELAVLCLSNSGNATGAADVDTDAFLLSIQGFTAATGVTNAVSSTSLSELPSGTVGLRVKVGSGTYYIPAVAAAEWN